MKQIKVKEIQKIGHTNPNEIHQSGQVISRGGCCHQSIPCSTKTHQRQYGKLVILGGIGRNERENRDSMRVMGNGSMYALKSHIALEPPLVIKYVERNQNKR